MFNLSKQYIAGSVEERVNQSNNSRIRFDEEDKQKYVVLHPHGLCE